MKNIPLKNLSLVLVAALLVANTCSGLYSGSSPVVKLTKDNFKKLVLDSDELWFIEFFAPWCGHCKTLAPEWEKAARQLKGVVKVGAVDMTTDQDVGAPYKIEGFPTIKFFGFKKTATDYNGGRDESSIVNYALDKVGSEVRKRTAGGDEKKQQKKPEGEDKGPVTDKDVYVLGSENFDKLVLGSKDIWYVEFYAPWCGHCKKLEPEWNEAATKMKGQVKFGKVDATVEGALAQRFGIKSYPTIKVWNYGADKTDAKAEAYNGGRKVAGIVDHATRLAEAADIAPEIHELVKQKVYDANCQGAVICIAAFLPNIQDSNAKERTSYLEVIERVAKKNRKHPFTFFWLQAGDQLDLEKELNLGFGFPAVVAISPNKSKLGVMKAAFDEEKLSAFLSDLISGGVALDDLKKKPEFKKSNKWDGKDAPPIETETETIEVN